MRLTISRSQVARKGMLGGNKGVEFTLSCRLELTPEEAGLVAEYKLEAYPLTWRNINGARVPDDTISGLVAGRSQTLTDVETLLGNEEIVKNACDALPPLFEVVRSFGGNEIIEYPRS